MRCFSEWILNGFCPLICHLQRFLCSRHTVSPGIWCTLHSDMSECCCCSSLLDMCSLQELPSDLGLCCRPVREKYEGDLLAKMDRKSGVLPGLAWASLITTRCAPFPIPLYLSKVLDEHIFRNSKFRLHAQQLWIKSCTWMDGSNMRDKCEWNEVQDKKHLVFFCRHAEVWAIHQVQRPLCKFVLLILFYRFLAAACFCPGINWFLCQTSTPFLACHHSITVWDHCHQILERGW